jgi:hypothetical protein
MAGRRTFISEIPKTAKRVAPPSLRPVSDSSVTPGAIAALMLQLPVRSPKSRGERS